MSAPRTALVRPDVARYDAWADCVRDFGSFQDMSGSGWWWVDDFGVDERSCAAMVSVAEQLRTQPFADFLVVSDCLWVVEPDESGATPDKVPVIGFLMVRHHIDTDFLRTEGGHIGYSIRPAYRRRGHASQALSLALDHARGLGLDRVLVTCDTDNVGSARTIERNGGVLEDVQRGKSRYWIALDR